MTMLAISNLVIEGRLPNGGWRRTVHGIDLAVAAGEVVALIGESGAGKSTVALAAMGYTRPGTRVTAGEARLGGVDLLTLPNATRRKMRGTAMAYVAQSAQASLNPAMSIGEQVAEPFTIHRQTPPGGSHQRVLDLLARLDLPANAGFTRRYPHQLSGGQQQRVMMAMAMTCSPGLLILDEPTTALDVTTQIEVLKALKTVLKGNNGAAIYVSHDLAVVAQIADRIVVMQHGRVVEQGPTAEIIHAPQTLYTRQLVEAFRPRPVSAGSGAEIGAPLLDVTAVSSSYARKPFFGRARKAPQVLQDVSLALRPREVLAIVGESGSGKSTLARVVAGLQPVTGGSVTFRGRKLAERPGQRSKETLRAIQIILQSPDLSLNPGQRIEQAIGRPLEFYFGLTGAAKAARIAELLTMVGLPADYAGRFPSELSGGQRQRVSIARAFAAQPDIVICDEILSSLDALVAGQVLDLMHRLRREHDAAYLFISHDISTVAAFADRVAVLYAGRVCEIGSPAAVFSAPNHPYTALLLDSVPALRTGWLEEVTAARGAVAEPGKQPASGTGCPFYRRCRLAIAGVCDSAAPPRQSTADGHVIYCHHSFAALAALQAKPIVGTQTGGQNGVH